MIKNESLYLAGPLVFYVNGSEMWQAWRREASIMVSKLLCQMIMCQKQSLVISVS